MGNCYAITAEYLLTKFQPYPGDDISNKWNYGYLPQERFAVKQISENSSAFLIHDKFNGHRLVIDKSRLANPKFNLIHWFATRRAQACHVDKPNKKAYPPQLEDPVALVTSHSLRSGIQSNYPNVNPLSWSDDHFFVHLKDYGSSTYVIVDDDLQLTKEIDLFYLEDTEFDLVRWYTHIVETEGAYHIKYLENNESMYYGTSRTRPSVVNERIRPTTVREEADLLHEVSDTLNRCSPYPGDDSPKYPIDPRYRPGQNRFVMDVIDTGTVESRLLYVYDRVRGFETYLSEDVAGWDQFSLGKWFAECCTISSQEEFPWEIAHEWMAGIDWLKTTIAGRNGPVKSKVDPPVDDDDDDDDSDDSDTHDHGPSDHDESECFAWKGWRNPALRTSEQIVEDNGSNDEGSYEIRDLFETTMALCGVQVDRNKYVNVQRNASRVKGANDRVLPKPVVIKFLVNGLPVRALIDSGSLGDFISSTLVDQLKLKRTILDKPLGLQLAVQGSRSKINASVDVNYSYQNIQDSRKFDIANLNDYDVILGTPWMWQHRVCIGLNPARIVIGSDTPLPIIPGPDTKLLLNAVSLSPDDEIVKAREELVAYADPICRNVEETELPPLRAINHTIPLIDENKVYPWRPSRCPEAFRSQWNQKRDAYLKSGRWKISTARNALPMLLIPKPHKPKNAPELRTVFDLRERNKNTIRMTSPLPDIEGVLRRTAGKKFRSVLDRRPRMNKLELFRNMWKDRL